MGGTRRIGRLEGASTRSYRGLSGRESRCRRHHMLQQQFGMIASKPAPPGKSICALRTPKLARTSVPSCSPRDRPRTFDIGLRASTPVAPSASVRNSSFTRPTPAPDLGAARPPLALILRGPMCSSSTLCQPPAIQTKPHGDAALPPQSAPTVPTDKRLLLLR